MKKMLTALLFAAPMALLFTLFTAPAAQADDRKCVGSIGARVIDDNLIVPKGKTCYLVGTTVKGNIKVNRNATLIARDIWVDGDVQAKYHKRVVVAAKALSNGKYRWSYVDGNIQLSNGGGGTVDRTIVKGDIQIMNNNARFTITNNRVDGNLQCKSNDPQPRGWNNKVDGNKENQCRRM